MADDIPKNFKANGSYILSKQATKGGQSWTNLKDLIGANLMGANLNGADLSGAKLIWANLSEANLNGAHLMGADLSGAKLIGANLSEAKLSEAKLNGAHLMGADLKEADLMGADLMGANLIWANLSLADLKGADLSGAKLIWAKLNGANLSEAKLNGAHLMGADLSGAKLIGADLSGAKLIGADLSLANLKGANLSEAKLNGTNLKGADLYWADLMGANIYWANLSGINIIKESLKTTEVLVPVTITIDESYERYNIKKANTLITKLSKILNLDDNPKILNIENGSVKLTIELPIEKAEELIHLFQKGILDQLKIKDTKIIGELYAAVLIDIKRQTNQFDVFMCHNSEDKSQVKKIGINLRSKGLLPWLDEWELRPGLRWQIELEKQIDNIKSAAVFIGNSGIGPWQHMEVDALIRKFVNRQSPVIPVVLKSCKTKPKIPEFLNGITWVNFHKRTPNPYESLIWGITGIKSTEQPQPTLLHRCNELQL